MKTGVSEFVETYWPFALRMEGEHGVPALVAMAQSALETGWGMHCPGNMMFGIKAGESWGGKKQLLTTTEYHKTRNVKYPRVISITKQGNIYKYRVQDYFRAYPSPYESFVDYARLLKTSKRYNKAFQYTDDPYQFAKEIAEGGYATAPRYYQLIAAVMKMIEKRIP